MALKRFGIEMEEYIGNIKHTSGAQMIGIKTDTEIFLIPSLIFTGIKTAKFGFEVLWLRNEAAFWTSKINLESAYNGFLIWCSLIYSTAPKAAQND